MQWGFETYLGPYETYMAKLFCKKKYLHNKHNEPELFELEIIYQMHLYFLNDIFMEI